MNQNPIRYKKKKEYAMLLNEIVNAIHRKDFKSVGKIATISAQLHQGRHPKKNLSFCMDLCDMVDALGVTVAHSGTYIGIILDKNDPNHQRKLSFIEKRMKENFLIPKKFNSLSKKCLIQPEEYLRAGSDF